MKDRHTSRQTFPAVIGLLTALLLIVAVAPATAALKHYDGTVLGTKESAQTFRIETQSGKVKFKVNGGTEFERISGGFAGLERGLAVEVDAKQTANGLVARQVETQGGGGGGDDNGSHGPNHG